MPIFRYFTLAFATLSAAAAAQVVYVQPPTPAADELAAEMRLLGANPTDVNAMIRAGELTLKLDDPTAAAGFFARAERIDPSNPRIKAGKGSILVAQERPNEALRQFFAAETLRGQVRAFAADRGLAYDLIGEQERAQRDYRLALKDGPADETLRRYALSLGISGKRDEALAQIDQLLRRSDRAAWRTRAFILAMTGDSTGAERIASSMMPGGMARGLQPFFERLPRLGPIDRAFAVHFGEVRATPQRLADARMKPSLPVLMPEAGRPAPVVLAAVNAAPAKKDRRSRRERKRDRIDVASATPPVPLPQPPAYQAQAATPTPSYVQPLPSVALASNRPLTTSPLPLRRAPAPGFSQPLLEANRRAGDAPVAAASAPAQQSTAAPERRDPTPNAASAMTQAATQAGASLAQAADPSVASATVPVTASSAMTIAPRPTADTNKRVALDAQTRALSDAPFQATPAKHSATAVTTTTPVVVEPRPEPAPVQVATLPPAASSASASPGTPDAAPQPVASAPTTVAALPPSANLPPAPGPAPRGEDMILAKIIANITVPGSELEADAAAPEAVATTAETRPVPAPIAVAETTPIRRVAAEKPPVERKTAEKPATAIAATDATATLVRKPGETRQQFEARKALATRAAVLPRKPGETARQFEARKLAARSDDDSKPLTRTSGETVRQFEARKLAARNVDDDAVPLVRKSGETSPQFETRKRAAQQSGADDDSASLTRKRGETARQFEARNAAAAKKPDLNRKENNGEPARIWVQVAGGANEGDLAKAWAGVKAKAPLALKGRGGWTTPLRATNRVLTGPFKTDAEARNFVNALSREGVSGFSFTSEAGQKVARLAGK